VRQVRERVGLGVDLTHPRQRSLSSVIE